jgi:hypothetical protein
MDWLQKKLLNVTVTLLGDFLRRETVFQFTEASYLVRNDEREVVLDKNVHRIRQIRGFGEQNKVFERKHPLHDFLIVLLQILDAAVV